MEKMLKIAQELKALKSHQEDVINTAHTIEKKADKIGDALLSETISSIRKKSEQSFADIENAIQNHHLRINSLDG